MQPRPPPQYQPQYVAQFNPIFPPQQSFVPMVPNPPQNPIMYRNELQNPHQNQIKNTKKPGRNFSLYIGRLCKEFNDEFIQQLLNYCGGVKKWKRAKGTFGFAEFTYAEGALRAYQVLNGLRVKDKKILVSIEPENLKQLKQFEDDLKNGLEPLRPSKHPSKQKVNVGDELKKRNEEALEKINALIKDRKLEPDPAAKSKTPSRSRSRTRSSRDRDRRRRQRKSRSRERRRKKAAHPQTQKELAKIIPKDPEETLAHEIDWNIVQSSGLVETKMRKWIDERLKEYLGGQEDIELTNFVVGLLAKHTHPTKIITELVVVLDIDSKKFVVKMWRRLIFETLKVKYKLDV